MNPVVFFDSITLLPPLDQIYSRLGYRKNLTQMNPSQKEEIEGHINKALSHIQLKGAALRLDIDKISPPKIILKGGFSFSSRYLSDSLKNSVEILLMAATAGKKIIKEISKKSASDHLTLGVIFDAVASEMTDAALGWIMDYFNQMIKRENKQVSKKRFSAGYGDFELANQKMIYDLLDLKTLDVKLNKNFILIPEKSVTAVAGIMKLDS
ncbi:MAG: methionine synthase [Candidatus Aureabacteria bacterium]|nr:methionine synthase [Candidatus Auribacterota bacterium]